MNARAKRGGSVIFCAGALSIMACGTILGIHDIEPPSDGGTDGGSSSGGSGSSSGGSSSSSSGGTPDADSEAGAYSETDTSTGAEGAADSAGDAGSHNDSSLFDGASDAAEAGTVAAADGQTCATSVLTPQAAVASSVQPASAGTGNVVPSASFAIDGDFTTRWASDLHVSTAWIYADFGLPVFVEEVDVIWETACATAFDIDVSNDATNWTPVKTVTGNSVGTAAKTPPIGGWAAPEALRYAGLAGRGRYVRINATVRCLPMYGYAIWEMRVLGDSDSQCTP